MDPEGIYSNLYDYDLGAEVHRLQEENTKLSATTSSLQADVEKLCNKITEMKKIQDNLSRNISELYKTAKAELERKDRIIAELRRELDNYVFRRNKRFQTDSRLPDVQEQKNISSTLKQEFMIKDSQILSTAQENRETRHDRLEKDAKNMKSHSQNYTSVLDDVELYVTDNRRYQLSSQKENADKREASPVEPVKKKIKYDDYKRTRLDKSNSDCERSGANTYSNRRDRNRFDHQRYDDRRSNERRYDDCRWHRENRRYDTRYMDERRYSEERRYDQSRCSDDPRAVEDYVYNDKKSSRLKDEYSSAVNTSTENARHRERSSNNQESKYDKCPKTSSKKVMSGLLDTVVEKSQNTVLKNLLEIEKKTVLITDPKQSPLREVSQENINKPIMDSPTKEDGELSDDSSRTVEKTYVETDRCYRRERRKSTHRREEHITTTLHHNLREKYHFNENGKEKDHDTNQKEDINVTGETVLKCEDSHYNKDISESSKSKKDKKIHHRGSSDNNDNVDNHRTTKRTHSSKNDKKKSSHRKGSNGDSEKGLNDAINLSANNEMKKAEEEKSATKNLVQVTKDNLNSISNEQNSEKKNKLNVDDNNTKIFSLSDTSLMSATENYHLSEIARKSEIPTLNVDDIVANTSYIASNIKTEHHSTITKSTLKTDDLHLFNQNSDSNKHGSLVSVPSVEATAFVHNIVTESNDTDAVQISIPDANVVDSHLSNVKTVELGDEKMVHINIPEKHIRAPKVTSIFSPLKPLERNVQQDTVLQTNLSKSFGDSSTSSINTSPGMMNNSQAQSPSAKRKRRRCVITIQNK